MGKADLEGEKTFHLSVAQTVGLIVCVVLLVLSVVYGLYFGDQHGRWWLILSTLIQIVSPIVVTLILVPKGKSEDYSTVATMAVDRLYDLYRAQDALADSLGELSSRESRAELEFAVAVSQRDLREQKKLTESSIGLWSEISEKAARSVLDRHKANAQILAEMEAELGKKAEN
ncbi:hypothetical protein [Corynebacterium sp. A21]|uniref:hypothetical protein n=1 Tax=Corynebacterium sp. A21 TaxID=3457318 RepID=UPI003FD1FC99